MANLTPQEESWAEFVFDMNNGYVLEKSGINSNRMFGNIIKKICGIDVYSNLKYQNETSKAKKLRKFFELESDENVGNVILELLKIRADAIDRKKEEDDEFVDEYDELAIKLHDKAIKMVGNNFSSNDERLQADISASNKVYRDLINICSRLCTNAAYSAKSSEDSMNDYIRDSMISTGYTDIKDQSRHGMSESGKKAGEIDLLLKKDNREIALIEALKLDCLNSTELSKHIYKVISNYNPLGTPVFVLCYCSANKFSELWYKIFDFSNNFIINEFEVKEKMIELPHQNAAIKSSRIIISKEEYLFPVTIMAINLHKN